MFVKPIYHPRRFHVVSDFRSAPVVDPVVPPRVVFIPRRSLPVFVADPRYISHRVVLVIILFRIVLYQPYYSVAQVFIPIRRYRSVLAYFLPEDLPP